MESSGEMFRGQAGGPCGEPGCDGHVVSRSTVPNEDESGWIVEERCSNGHVRTRPAEPGD